MIFLLLAILCSASINVCFKISENRPDGNSKAVSTLNQATAAIVSFIFMGGGKLFSLKWLTDMTYEWTNVFSSSGNRFSDSGSLGYALLVAVLGGLFSYFGLIILQNCTRKNGTVMTIAFNKLGLLVPIIFSMIFFHEKATGLQIVGMLLAVFAIMLIYFKKEAADVITSPLLLIGTLFCGGFYDFISKIYEARGSEYGQTVFVFWIFLISTAIALIAFLKSENRNINKGDIFFGCLTGVIIQLISKFLLKAISVLPSVIVFTIFSVGVIVTVNIVNLLVFKEKLSKRQYIATSLMLAACLLLS